MVYSASVLTFQIECNKGRSSFLDKKETEKPPQLFTTTSFFVIKRTGHNSFQDIYLCLSLQQIFQAKVVNVYAHPKNSGRQSEEARITALSSSKTSTQWLITKQHQTNSQRRSIDSKMNNELYVSEGGDCCVGKGASGTNFLIKCTHCCCYFFVKENCNTRRLHKWVIMRFCWR